MTPIWLLLWPKLISTTTKCDGDAAAAAATACSTRTRCHGLKKLVRRVKKQSRMLRRAATRPSPGGSFECKYDPLSYSLNFDSSGWGSFLDGDYYQFHAFSSRFIAKSNPIPDSTSTPTPTPRIE